MADGFSIPTRKALTLRCLLLKLLQGWSHLPLVGVTLPSVNPQQAAEFLSRHAKTECKHEQNDLHNCSSSKCYQVAKTSGTTDATINTSVIFSCHFFILFSVVFCPL